MSSFGRKPDTDVSKDCATTVCFDSKQTVQVLGYLLSANREVLPTLEMFQSPRWNAAPQHPTEYVRLDETKTKTKTKKYATVDTV